MPIHRNSLVAISNKGNMIQPQSLSSLGHYDVNLTYNGDSRPSIDYYPAGAINSRVILPKLNTQSMDSLGYSTDPTQPLQPLVPINIQPRASIFPTVYNKAIRRQSWMVLFIIKLVLLKFVLNVEIFVKIVQNDLPDSYLRGKSGKSFLKKEF